MLHTSEQEPPRLTDEQALAQLTPAARKWVWRYNAKRCKLMPNGWHRHDCDDTCTHAMTGEYPSEQWKANWAKPCK